jgi:hypothetical protein
LPRPTGRPIPRSAPDRHGHSSDRRGNLRPTLVTVWQSGAISRDTLLHNLRTGEVVPIFS